jgi:undecaprenyl-diphosphatase
MDTFLGFDTQLFFFINHLPHVPLADALAGFMSGIGESGFIWFALGAWLVFREEHKDHQFFLPLAVAGFSVWMIVDFILKPLVARLRPSSALDAATVVGGYLSGYSFPSGHAAFAFALATVLSYREPRWTKWLYTLASLVALSRIYLGYHYPVDVIAGGLLGWGIGLLVVGWYKERNAKKRYNRKNEKKRKRTPHASRR